MEGGTLPWAVSAVPPQNSLLRLCVYIVSTTWTLHCVIHTVCLTLTRSHSHCVSHCLIHTVCLVLSHPHCMSHIASSILCVLHGSTTLCLTLLIGSSSLSWNRLYSFAKAFTSLGWPCLVGETLLQPTKLKFN